MELLSYAFNEDKSEEQRIYEEYKQISLKYTKQLE